MKHELTPIWKGEFARWLHACSHGETERGNLMNYQQRDELATWENNRGEPPADYERSKRLELLLREGVAIATTMIEQSYTAAPALLDWCHEAGTYLDRLTIIDMSNDERKL